MDNRPIGVFDSGVGGITVLRALKNLLPKEKFIYFGDIGRVPYGSKSPEVIVDYAVQIASFLRDRNAKEIVVACNTASALAGHVLEDVLDIPVVSVIKPASKTAITYTQNGRIGIIGTKKTIESEIHKREILLLNSDLEVYNMACPMFVPYIEEDEINSPGLDAELTRCLGPLKSKGIDTLVLGCTHYPLIEDKIRAFMGNEVHLVGPGECTAEEAYDILCKQGLLNTEKVAVGDLSFFITGGLGEFQGKLARYGMPHVHIQEVEIASLKEAQKVRVVEPYNIQGEKK